MKEHKDLINDLLQVINGKREQMYLLESRIEILEKEHNLWVYDIENIKLNKNIQKRLKDLNLEQMKRNIYDELAHKK